MAQTRFMPFHPSDIDPRFFLSQYRPSWNSDHSKMPWNCGHIK